MPDITMCSDKDCWYRKDCLRYTAVPSEFWQSYFSESPRESDELLCGFYIQAKDSCHSFRNPDEVP